MTLPSPSYQGTQEGGPRHEHDCDECKYLGRSGLFDLYFHDGGENPTLTTVVARWGVDGDYLSGLWAAVPHDGFDACTELAEARSRAIALGHGRAIEIAETRGSVRPHSETQQPSDGGKA